jgi:hypothetical protein
MFSGCKICSADLQLCARNICIRVAVVYRRSANARSAGIRVANAGSVGDPDLDPDLFAGSGSGNFSPDPDPEIFHRIRIPDTTPPPPKGAYYYQKR